MSTAGADQFDVVVSYAEEDAAWRLRVPHRCLGAGGRACARRRAIVPGGVRLEELERGIAESAKTVIVLSDAYVRHGQRLIEMMAQHLGLITDQRRLVVVQIEDDLDVPLLLQALVPIDATDHATWHRAVEQLCALLHRSPPAAGGGAGVPVPGDASVRRGRRARRRSGAVLRGGRRRRRRSSVGSTRSAGPGCASA